MARAAALVAALVLCAAVLVPAAHAGRVLDEYQELEAGLLDEGATTTALPPLQAAASSPESASAHEAAAVAGGDRDREKRGGAIADVLWFVLKWANEPPAGDRRKDY